MGRLLSHFVHTVSVAKFDQTKHHRSTIIATPLAGVYVTSTSSARTFPRHWHGSFGVGVIEAGAQRSASGRGIVEAWAGHCITHNPGEVHDGQAMDDRGRRWRMFHIEPLALARLLGCSNAADLEWRDPVLQNDDLRTTLRRSLDLVDAAALARPSAVAAYRVLLEEALVLASSSTFGSLLASRRDAESDGRFAAVIERLKDGVDNTPTLDELAALAETNRFSLVRGFRRRHGLPPLAWLQQLRLQRAQERISAGWSLADTALACGFSDQSHMTRLFSRQFGHTPGTWRKAAAPSA